MSERRFRRDREQQEQREERRRLRMKRAAIAGGAAFCAGAFAAPAANAATFTVTNTTDGDPGSLRDAVQDANAAGGPDDIVFASGLTGTIALTTGEIAINEALAIHGPGASTLSVSGTDTSRIFAAVPTTDDDPVSISGLTMTDGNANGPGGAVYNGHADLTVSDSVISSSDSVGPGGGIDTAQSATVLRTTLTGNTAHLVPGPNKYGYGGGVAADGGSVIVRDSVLTGNHAESGGGGVGVYSGGNDEAGESLIERSTISGNTSDGDGGGVYLEDNYANSPLRIDSSTISGNQAQARGGGLCICEDPVENTTVSNSTISGNKADLGGGVYNENSFSTMDPEGRELYLTGVTIAGNHAYVDGGGIDRQGGTRSVVQLTNAIVADNTAANNGPDLYDGGSAPADEIAARYTLVETAGSPFTDQGRNITGKDPQLGALASNGGPTQTRLPSGTSPVLDKGIAGGLTTDQRGGVRPFDLPGISSAPAGDAADMGAVESAIVNSPAPAPQKKKKKCKKKRKKGKSAAAAKKKCKKKKK